MADKFGLSNLRDGVKKRADELAHKDNVNARSYDEPRPGEDEGPFKPFTFQQEDFDRTEPDKDALRTYWRQYETTPFVRKSISSFASQVMEPGYYIKARGIDEEDLVELDHWLAEAAVVNGRPGKDFRQLAKKMVVQMEVRGTAFAEVAPDKNDPEKIAGLKLINAETMEAVTRPGQSILLSPDDIDEYDDAPEAESGGAAAWLQDLGETETFFGTPVSGRNRGTQDNDVDNDFKIGFQREEIVFLPRDADAGEIFGTSRLEAVSDRIKGLRNKLCDNDDAIASKAYPLWLFLFGSEDNPWEGSDINEFMRAHEMENFQAGMKQGVRGDVSVETVSGEVADIAEALSFDVEWIMSIMPIPPAMLGVFQSDDAAAGQAGAVFQQQEVQRQIKDTRRDIEDEFTPVIQDVAKQVGIDEEAAETIRLKIGSPGEPEQEVPSRENVIRYIPKDQREAPADSPSLPGGEGSGEGDERDDQTESPGNDGIPSIGEAAEARGAQSWHSDHGVAQLSLSEQSELSDAVYDTLRQAREQTLNEVGRKFSDQPQTAAVQFPTIANRVMSEQMTRGRFHDTVEPLMRETLADSNEGRFARSNSVKYFVQDVEHATEDALEEMLRLMRIQVRRGANQDDSWKSIRDRVEREYDDANLRQRAELIAHMEMKNAEETSKLREFERDDAVIGVRVVNENPSTPLTESLSGVEVFFEDGDIQAQLMSNTREEFLHQGFDPLPPTPPFHFRDSSKLEPIYGDDR